MAQFPTITYSNVKHKVDNGLSGGVVQVKDETITPVFNTTAGDMTTYRVSCVSPYNQITGNFTSNRALTRFEIRVNPIETTDYGPGIGNLAFEATTIAANTSRSFTITVNDTIFAGSQSNTYRVCLMAQSEVDYSWDFTQLYMVVGSDHTGSYVYKPTDYDGYDVHGTDIIS